MSKQWVKVHLKARERAGFTSYIAAFWRDGKRQYGRSFHSKKLAEDYRNRLEQFLNGRGENPDVDLPPERTEPEPAPEGMHDWAQTVEAFCAKAKRTTTAQSYKYGLRAFGAHAGVKTVEDMTEERVAAAVAKLQHEGRSRATVAAYLRMLSAFFHSLKLPPPISDEVRRSWSPYSKKLKRQRPHVYTPAQFQSIILACEAVGKPKIAKAGMGKGRLGRGLKPGERSPLWWKCFLTVLHDCGLRFAEAAHLIWRDVDFEAGEIRIQPHAGLPGVLPWQPKGKAHRSVPLTPRLARLLVKLQQAEQERIPEDATGSPYVFVPVERYTDLRQAADDPGREFIAGVGKAFQAIRNRAGVHEGTLHDFRRTATINWLRTPGLTPPDVQILAGHEDIATTLGIYASVTQAEAVERAKAAINRPAQAEPARKGRKATVR